MMREVHELPGTTFSNPQERGGYPSAAAAALTLRELERWLVLAVGVYHGQVDELAAVAVERWDHVAAASWNRHLATLRSFFAWCARQRWTTGDPTVGIDRRRVPAHNSRVIAYGDLGGWCETRSVAGQGEIARL